ncbi:unnamed protein product, partial [Effrenium voratum]
AGENQNLSSLRTNLLMPMSGFYKEGALMFRLQGKMSQEEFLHEFDALFGYGQCRQYNFVHLPWDTLAVVNFSSIEACVQCYSQSLQLMRMRTAAGLGASHP